MSAIEKPPARLLRLREVTERIQVNEATVYRWIAAEQFPPPIKLTPSCSRWSESELNDWIEARRVQFAKAG